MPCIPQNKTRWTHKVWSQKKETRGGSTKFQGIPEEWRFFLATEKLQLHNGFPSNIVLVPLPHGLWERELFCKQQPGRLDDTMARKKQTCEYLWPEPRIWEVYQLSFASYRNVQYTTFLCRIFMLLTCRLIEVFHHPVQTNMVGYQTELLNLYHFTRWIY